MKVIKVGIIDDDGSKVTQMMAYLLYGMKDASKQKADRYSNVRFEVLEIPLSADMNDIAEYIIDEKIDALLIDYNLASYATVPYTGVQLARYIQERFMEFPLFILTSYEDELYEQEVFDVYQIFDFERYLSEPQERVELHYKLIQQVATVYKGNIIKNLIMDCQSYTKYRPNETTGGIFVSWRRKEELPTGA